MKVTNAFIANYAEEAGSLAYITGAFPEWWWVPSLPSQVSLAVVVSLALAEEDLGTEQQIGLAVLGPEAEMPELLAQAQVTRHRGDGPKEAPVVQAVIFKIGVEFRAEGLHNFVVTGPDDQAAEIPLYVRLVEPAIKFTK